ncbi:MAG: SIMPL domain-containing protein [Candidatus Falkowbacteria bacterium]|nr:SIMPL domain-containing protein [Candidatus Falkowbacteria bacterium]
MNLKTLSITASIVLMITAIFVAVLTRNELKKYQYIGNDIKDHNSISISGEGEVITTPDIANIQLGLNTEKNSISEAQKENTNLMNKIIDTLKNKFQIAEKDIQTANYFMTPNYDWKDNQRLLKSYSVSQTLNVKIRDLNKISDILQLAGEYNLNQVDSLSFTVDKPEELKQQARIKALENAKQKAENLAKIMGVKLGKIINFSESAGGNEYPTMMKSFGTGANADMAAPTPTIQAGSTSIKIYATVQYELE